MATIKKNWLRAGISLFVLFLGVFFVVKAMEKEEVNVDKKAHIATWNFTGTDVSEILQPEKWQPGATSNNDCEQDLQMPLPCQFTVNDAEITTPEELVSYFEDSYPTNTAVEVRNNADSQKDEE